MKQPKYNPGDIVHVITNNQDIRSAKILHSTAYVIGGKSYVSYMLSDQNSYEEESLFPSFGEALKFLKNIP
jgi:hypothetical protein